MKFKATSEGGLSFKAGEPSQPSAQGQLTLNVSGEATQAGPATARFGAEFQGRADAVELKIPIKSGHVQDTAILFGSLSGPSDQDQPAPVSDRRGRPKLNPKRSRRFSPSQAPLSCG